MNILLMYNNLFCFLNDNTLTLKNIYEIFIVFVNKFVKYWNLIFDQ